MPAILLMLLLPVVLIFALKSYHKDKQISTGEKILRYIVYFGLLLFMSYIVLSIMKDDDTAFFEKLTQSFEFSIKFICLQVVMAVGIAGVEWLFLGKRITDSWNWEKFYNGKIISFSRKYICPFLIYVLAAVVIIMNVRLMFDNVVWGDEAFSANTAKKSMYGIMQVLYYWDNHPPLHYYWTKMFGEIFGHTVPVYHLAALVPFIGGIILAVTQFRKRFGNIPAAFFVVISGLGAACIEYNLEIRMYSLAFCGLLGTFYCSYRVISTGKKSSWISMVLWALVAAYSHYYALAAAGILLFCTGVAFWLKHRGKTWLKGLGAIVAFIVGYAPWLFFLFTAMRNVSSNWWMTDILDFDISLNMVMGSNGLSTFIMPLFLLVIAVLVLAESSLFYMEKKDGQESIQIHRPNLKEWSDETYSVIVGTFTIIGTLVFAYLLCFIMGPVLAQRYLYPLSAVTFAVLVVGISRVLKLLKKWGEQINIPWIETTGNLVMVVFLVLFLVIGLNNNKDYSTLASEQNEMTNATLELIGEPDEDVQMVSNGVKHLGWTVLYHYYPNNEIVNGNYNNAESDEFWYFNPSAMSDGEIADLEQRGYKVTSYGQMQLSQYPFELYFIENIATSGN